VESSPERASSSQLPATELLLHAIAAARTVGIVSGVTQLTAGERDLAALQVLVILGPQRASDLASMLRISRAAATQLIDSLEHAGLAHREPDPRDRRAVLISATPTGHLVALAEIAPAAVLAQAIEELTDAERSALVNGLQALLARLGQRLPTGRRTDGTAGRYRSRSGSETPQSASNAPIQSGHPLSGPRRSPIQPASSDPPITPREYKA